MPSHGVGRPRRICGTRALAAGLGTPLGHEASIRTLGLLGHCALAFTHMLQAVLRCDAGGGTLLRSKASLQLKRSPLHGGEGWARPRVILMAMEHVPDDYCK